MHGKIKETVILLNIANMKCVKLLFVFFIIIFFCEILFLKFEIIPLQIDRVSLALGFSPVLFASILFLFIMYENWFSINSRFWVVKLKKFMFLIFTLSLCLIWILIFYYFILL